jgi:hypothetical protein
VYVDQLGAGLIESECVENAGVPNAGGRLRQLEPIFEQGCVEEPGITSVDEKINVFCSRKCLFEADIAFPMTVADAFLLQRVEKTTDDRLARDSSFYVIRLNRYGFGRPVR